jgi:hypothetical protein
MKGHTNKITIAVCSLTVPVIFGCAEAWQEGYNEMSKINQGAPFQLRRPDRP